ncbi:uracil-DNA glycosylase family protein [Methylotetracoccus oryzae]|uniref:uracil-DNA glycosylase family protein n=1 Tax=Methylotetracoccus oryzae TaxID=1919059 RepID=UPI001119F0F5|nr:uracil-DNA glycosylase family protein [Methylotetracoccus oryzae]
MTLIDNATTLQAELRRIRFVPPVSHVYDPLDYAWEPHRTYLERYGQGEREILMVGMNPGPWGMVQTGIPFGDVESVRTWLRIDGPVAEPASLHPKRPVFGYTCPRREGSGRRLWGWARDRYGDPERFFDRFFVGNYCPLCFFLEAGTNLTPDKLPLGERRAVTAACDRSLQRMTAILKPRWVLGIGRFAERRAAEALAGTAVRVGGLPHPSPASPLANRGWAEQMDRALERLGIAVP